MPPINLVRNGVPKRVEVSVVLDTGPGTVESRLFHFDAFKLSVSPDPADATGKVVLVRALAAAVVGETLTLEVTGDSLAGAPVHAVTSNRLEFLVTSPIGMLTDRKSVV